MTKIPTSTKIILSVYLVIIFGTLCGLGGHMAIKVDWW